MKLNRAGILLCLVGPTGSGKTTIAQEIIAKDSEGVRRSISTTSRTPRPGEVEGECYHFVTREQFKAQEAAQGFFESEEVHGNFYGTPRAGLIAALDAGKDLILVIDIKGALRLRQEFPERTVICFLAPPSFAAMEARVKGRGDASPEDLNKRLHTATQEYDSLRRIYAEGGKAVDYFVVNDALAPAIEIVRGILLAERAKLSRIAEAAIVAVVGHEEA